MSHIETTAETDRWRDALERIALLDDAEGHELTRQHALEAVAIATSTLGKHPSQIYFERLEKERANQRNACIAGQRGEKS